MARRLALKRHGLALIIAIVSAASWQSVLAGNVFGSSWYEGRLLRVMGTKSADTPEFFTSVQHLTGSDWTHVADLSGNWKQLYRPGDGQNLAISRSQAQLGVFFQDWGMAYIRRRDISITANRDALDLLYLQKNNLSSPAGTVFHPEVHASAFSAHGPHINRRLTLLEREDFRLQGAVGIGYLTGVSMRQADLQGLVQKTNDANYSLIIPTLSDIDANKTYPFMGDSHPSGSGYAVDIALHATWQDQHQAWLLIDDWQTRMHWKQVPSTRATADSRTVGLGQDGYLAYAPAIQGKNARLDLTQRIESTVTLGYARDVGPVMLSAESIRISGIYIPSVAIGYRAGDNIRWVVGKELRFHTLSAGLNWNNWSILAFSQRPDVSSSQGYGFTLRYQMNVASP